MFELASLGIGYGSLLMLVMLIVLLLTGMQLAFATGLVALVFALGWFGPDALPIVSSRLYSFIGNYVFLAVPMFVLMASLLDRSGIAKDLFNAMRVFAGQAAGGVAIQTVVVAFFLLGLVIFRLVFAVLNRAVAKKDLFWRSLVARTRRPLRLGLVVATLTVGVMEGGTAPGQAGHSGPAYFLCELKHIISKSKMRNCRWQTINKC